MQPDSQLILFDLDGTLADTAPDLAAAANSLRVDRGLEPLPLEVLRPVASAGARGLIGAALGIKPGDDEFETLKHTFLDRYEQDLCARTTLFAEVPELLDQLEAGGRSWGVVTNKAERFALPLLRELGLAARAAAIVGGDTTAHTKPHPLPLLHAAELAGVAAQRCVYVGDDLRDIQAGKAASMPTVAAAYGYCGDADPPEQWGADLLIRSPAELSPWLGTFAA
ncbi:MAG: phosphoglycolate phosphatase [Candidatus Protistobacter heckmanni]|nr:phosphoglycolate phosphatase [Candidatus Protistobacter heckmanni]